MSDNTREPEDQKPGSGDSPLSDETRQWSRDGLPATEGPAPDETIAGAEHTSVLPAAGADPWMGRAEVRGGAPVRGAVPPPEETDDPEPEPGSRWWMPVVLAVVGLLLLLALVVGIWLVIANSNNPAPTPSPTRPEPTVEQTTSAPSPSSAASSVPATASVPAVVGLMLDDATKALDAVGLNYRLEYRATTDAASGTVIGVDPKAGTQVPAGREVLLVIASTPLPPPSPSPSPSDEESPSPVASAS